MGQSIEEWKNASAPWLAVDADCASPDSQESPGAELLCSVRDATLELLEYVGDDFDPDTIDDDGSVHEIADNAASVYTHTLWRQFIDLAAYQEEPDLTGEWPDDLNKAAGLALFQIAERLAWAIIRSVHEWREEQEPDDADDADETDE